MDFTHITMKALNHMIYNMMP